LQKATRRRAGGVFSSFDINVPQIIRMWTQKAKTTEFPRDVFDTMQVYLGSLYVNDFNLLENYR